MSASRRFRTQLEQAVNARHSRMNPFTEKWVKGELTRAQLGAVGVPALPVRLAVPALVRARCTASARTPTPATSCSRTSSRRSPGTKHVDLLIRFGEACGVSRDRGRDDAAAPDARAALTAWCYETSRQPFHVAAAGLLVGLESQVPGIYKRNLPPLKTHYGFTDHEVEFFAIHIEADEVHGERGYQIVERHCTTPEQAGARRSSRCAQATEMRWQYMTGLHRAFVAKEDAVSEVRGRVASLDELPAGPADARGRSTARGSCWPGSATQVYACGDVVHATRAARSSEGKLNGHAARLPVARLDVRRAHRRSACSRPRGGPVPSLPGPRSRAARSGSRCRDARSRSEQARACIGRGIAKARRARLRGRHRRRRRGRPPGRLRPDGRRALGHAGDRPRQGQRRGRLPREHARSRGALHRARSSSPTTSPRWATTQFVFGKGGVPLVEDGRVVGAVGVSGAVPADNDHAIADAAAGHPDLPKSH